MSDGVRWAWRPQEGPQKALVDCPVKEKAHDVGTLAGKDRPSRARTMEELQALAGIDSFAAKTCSAHRWCFCCKGSRPLQRSMESMV
jgi:hypothetical protein